MLQGKRYPGRDCRDDEQKKSPRGESMSARLSKAREAMSKVDTAWLRMESPTNLMMITGVMIFAERMALDKLKALIAQRWLAYKRFQQKAVDTVGAAYWETDRDLDLDWHVRLVALPGKADKPALEEFV